MKNNLYFNLILIVFLTLLLIMGCSEPSGGGGDTEPANPDATKYTLTIEVLPGDNGIVTQNPQLVEYEEGSIVNLEAFPYNGYNFLYWEGYIQSEEGTKASVKMDSDIRIKAFFSTDLIPEADLYEDDDDDTRANPIAIGAPPQEHTIHTADDRDYLSVTLEEGVWYDIKTHFLSQILDTEISLVGDMSRLYAEDDDNGEYSYSKITYQCKETGIYYIRVNGNYSDVGDYTIDININSDPPLVDSFEADNWYPYAKPIIIDAAPQERTFHETGDEDFIVVNLTAGCWYNIETQFLSQIVDTSLILHDSSRSFILHENDSGSGNYSRIIYQCSNSGSYFIEICEWNNSIGDYTVSINNIDGPPVGDIYEPDNFPATAKEIIVNGRTQYHNINYNQDTDWLYFYGEQFNVYTITIDSSTGGFSITLFYEGSYEQPLVFGGVGNPISFIHIYESTYFYIQVEPYSGFNDYTIKVEQD